MSDSKSRRRYRVDRCASRRFARSGSAAENRQFPCRWVCWSKRRRKSFRRERTTMLRAERTAKPCTAGVFVPRMLWDVSKRDLSVEVLGAHLPAPARSGDVRQRDSPRGGYFQGSRAGGTSRAGGPSLPVGAGGGGRRRRAGGTAAGTGRRSALQEWFVRVAAPATALVCASPSCRAHPQVP